MNYLRETLRILKGKYCKKSYSQCGEDIIVECIFDQLKLKKNIVYLDLGANHPVYLSNTYFFYKKGCNGFLVEADPKLCGLLKKIRPRDKCINAGVGTSSKSIAKFYIMTADTLNTFSKEEAERIEKYGVHKIKKVIDIEILTVSDIIKNYMGKVPDLISLDVESLDFDIIKTIDFTLYRPKVFIVETLEYDEGHLKGKRLQDVIDYMKNQNYFIYADTYLNTIFVDQVIWENR